MARDLSTCYPLFSGKICFFFEFRLFLREVNRKRGREGNADSGKKGGGECWVGELAITGDACVLRVF